MGDNKAKVVFQAPLVFQRAEIVNLLEESLGPLSVKDGQVDLDLQPFEMVTISLTR